MAARVAVGRVGGLRPPWPKPVTADYIEVCQLCAGRHRPLPPPLEGPPLAKQQARGKDKTAGLILLRRRLSDTVFAALRADQRSDGHQPITLSAAA
jgi:hypothetical protein